MKTNSLKKSPIVITIGLLLSLIACNNQQSPAEITDTFWDAIAKNDLQRAKKLCSSHPPNIPNTFNPPLNSTVTIGRIVIDGNQATVETRVSTETNGSNPSFTTFLINKDKHWKIDCKRSINSFSSNPFSHFFDKLNDLGDTLNKQLEQQLPLFEEKMESFGQQIQKKIENLEEQLQSPKSKEQNNPYQDSI